MDPAQIYASPDSNSVWVADQGGLDLLVPGREVFRLDGGTRETTGRVTVDEAP